MIRKATGQDIASIAAIYDKIHAQEDAGLIRIGWKTGVYPTEDTARTALAKGDLFVLEQEGRVVAAGRINREQVPEYADCAWQYDAPENEVMVLHTLVVDPDCAGRGCAKEFVAFYEQYARENGCPNLRMDTNVMNARARGLYRGLGYTEPGLISCVFNGIPGTSLVCLEKRLDG